MKLAITLGLCLFTFISAQTSYNVSFVDQINSYGANPSASNYSEVWGWTDTIKNKEYAFIGTKYGTSIVDISVKPIKEVSFLMGPTSNYNYHEFRTYKNYLYIGAEGTDVTRRAGIQIIDLSTLPDSASFKKVYVWIDTNSTTGSITKYYRAHTISVEKNFLYINGGNDFGGTKVLDITDPLNPRQVGSYGKGNNPYVHDSFIRNDTLYAAAIGVGRLDIVDFTVKGHYHQLTSSKVISKTPTVPEGRTHQVWLSEDGKTMFVATEGSSANFPFNLHIYNISDKTNPVQIATWTSSPMKSIHNVFVKGDFIYIAYYSDGFRVLDISNPSIPIEVAYYRTYSPAISNPPVFAGAWGVYPYFPSGLVVVSDMNTGLYVLNVKEKKGGRITGTVVDASTQLKLTNVSVTVQEMNRTYSTNFSGQFLYGSAEGNHTVTFSKSGYVTKTISIYTYPAVLETVYVSLTPNISPTAIEQHISLSTEFAVSQNFPNPFNPSTKISFSLPEENNTSLKVFNSLGQEVATLIDQPLRAGTYSTEFSAAALPSGIYFYTLQSGSKHSTKIMVLTR
ncbi:MAG: choice-of-anchor B family protein [Bacteroidetes bacterium]|nr:choice-of-anchor B family protein [Bacteroidota bacterium]